jgi:hypothetical protein
VQIAVCWHVGQIKRFAVAVEFPAVIDAPEAAFFVATKEKIGTTVRAMGVQHANMTITIPEGDEFFAQNIDPYGWPVCFGQFFRQGDRLPKPPEIGAHGRIGVGLSQHVILFARKHGASSLSGHHM